jgi:hypothetical protein
MNPVFQFLAADGSLVGCGTQLELDYWKSQGTMNGYRIGERIGWEHPREDAKRRKAWGIVTAHDLFAAMVKSDKEFSA